MHQPIIKLKQTLKAKNLQGLALDIDDTLADSSDYWVKKTQEKFGNPENLTVKQVRQKYRYSYYAPYWNRDDVRQWEKQVRHDDQLHRSFPLIPNANHIVEKIHKIVPIVTYLTARSKTVLPGTKAWLDQHNFPKVNIIYRPKSTKLPQSLAWKAKVLEYLYPQVIAIVDDHPQLAKDLSKSYKGTVFLYDYPDQAPRSDINIISCKTWNDVLKEITKLKSTN